MGISETIYSQYDVIKHEETRYIGMNQTKAMEENGRIYRDESGALISEETFNWEEIKRRVQHNEIELGRSKEANNVYRKRMETIKKEWKSIDDYCKHAFLLYPVSVRMEDGRSVKYVDDNASTTVEGGMRLAKNDFPYNFSSDIEHFVLWYTKPVEQSILQQFVDKSFSSAYYDVLIFENIKKNKSVKSVQHFHVIVHRKPNPVEVAAVSIASNL